MTIATIAIMPLETKAQERVKQTAGRDALGDFAPQFARLNDDVLFGEVWSRTEDLGLRDRSLVTITALISQGITDSSLAYHLQTARDNGITRSEIAEIITHIAFYAGWPRAWATFRLATGIWNEQEGEEETKADTGGDKGREEFEREMMFPIGEPNTGFARYFSGESFLAPLSVDAAAKVFNVTFAPGCRNNWHIHHADQGGGQILVAVAGHGLYQLWGEPVRRLAPGDAVTIPAGVKHWHGADDDSWFAHLAIEVPGTNARNEWLESSRQ